MSKTVDIKLRGPLRLVLAAGEEVTLRVLVVDEKPRGDAHVERAIAAMTKAPERAWTVETLARLAGLSRAAFARRFQRVVGIPPLRHLTELRMQLAAARLEDTNEALAAIGAAVGYESEFAFARAFKRRFAVAPGTYRRGSITRAAA